MNIKKVKTQQEFIEKISQFKIEISGNPEMLLP